MTLEVAKKERETTQSLVRRFTNALKESGILVRARKNRFKKREKSEQMKKKAALRREEIKGEYERLRKMGESKR